MDGMETTGIVFDIQRASLHDGPGVRTTVFLKGCPLRCLWCHNPEATEFKPQLYFNEERCTLCGACVSACPNDVHAIRDGVHRIDFEVCNVSGSCVRACTYQALKIIGREMRVADVMAEVLADRAFYARSGGGLTLSGGEPMAQFAFSLELLKAAKAEGIHTCLETSGFWVQERYAEILPFVDLFLYDYKITGSAEHKAYTGVPNELILANLDYLYRQNKALVLRCPIIPGINDAQSHFNAIHALAEQYPGLMGIDLLPYHDLGNSKRTAIGADMTLEDLATTAPDIFNGWVDQLHALGCKKARIG
jgi:pyruvate formate lyase activating enzyme